MKNKLVSVIIPSYNREKLISRAINSILNQTYKNIEIVVVDDGSTDKTEDVIKQLNVSNLKYIKLSKNRGACKARNIGIENASGEYIAFLDSDDEWVPDKLEKQINFMEKHDADIVVCNFYYEKNGKRIVKISKNHGKIIRKNEILGINMVTTGAILAKKSVLESVGLFDNCLPRYQDWDLILRIMDKYVVYLINEPLLIQYFQSASITNSTSKEKKYSSLLKIYEKNKKDYDCDKKGYSDWCWTASMYSLYSKNPRIDLMQNSIFSNKLNFKRLIVFLMIKFGLIDMIKNIYAKNH